MNKLFLDMNMDLLTFWIEVYQEVNAFSISSSRKLLYDAIVCRITQQQKRCAKWRLNRSELWS